MRRRQHHKSAASAFSAHVVDLHGQIVVAVSGEIDLSTGDELWAAIEEAATRSPRLVIDLTETTFIDSSGLAVLVRAHHRLGQIPEAVVLRAPSSAARKVLDISGVDRLLTIEDGPAT